MVCSTDAYFFASMPILIFFSEIGVCARYLLAAGGTNNPQDFDAQEFREYLETVSERDHAFCISSRFAFTAISLSQWVTLLLVNSVKESQTKDYVNCYVKIMSYLSVSFLLFSVGRMLSVVAKGAN